MHPCAEQRDKQVVKTRYREGRKIMNFCFEFYQSFLTGKPSSSIIYRSSAKALLVKR